MQNNVFLRLAQERYTTKHYNGQQIPREEFDTLLEILRLTPTSVNAQALHYFTATSQEARERLLPAFPEFNRDRITGASDVVVFTVPKTLTEAHLRRVLDKEESDGRFPNAEVKNAQDQGRRYFPENRGIYTQSDSPKKSSRNIWSLAVVSVDQRY